MLETIAKKNGIQSWEKSFPYKNIIPQRKKTGIEDFFQIEGYLTRQKIKQESILEIIEEKPIKEVQITVLGTSFSSCAPLYKIHSEIKDSTQILELEENWDDEGAKKVQESIFIEAVKFLLNYSNFIYKNFDIIISTPEINPCIDGSIDLSFRNQNARLLINIQEENEKLNAVFYGDLYDNKIPIKGNVPTKGVFEHLAHWMKNLS